MYFIIHSSTHLPSDIEPLQAGNVFNNQRNKLFPVLQIHLSNIAIKLYMESVISAAALADAMNQAHVAGVRTVSLLSVIEDKIRAEPRIFTEFVRIIESEPTLRSLANELVEEYLKGICKHDKYPVILNFWLSAHARSQLSNHEWIVGNF